MNFAVPPAGRARASRRLLPLIVGGAGLAVSVAAAPAPEPGAAILQDLRGFRELGRVLYVAAHPDDENTQLIAYLARGRDYRTAYLSLTRGDGGQNVLGPEFGDELGVIRTQELLAARRLDGGRQFFSRARDFGYSKDYRQTLTKWDREEVVADIVRVIRDIPPRRGDHPLLARAGQHPRPPHGVGRARPRGLQAGRRPEGVSRPARRACSRGSRCASSGTTSGAPAGTRAAAADRRRAAPTR